MSDYNKDVGFPEFERYAQAKNLKPHCPMCAQKKWTVIDERDGQSPSLMTIDRAAPKLEGAHAALVFLIRCDNCGFFAPMDRGIITAWLEENNE